MFLNTEKIKRASNSGEGSLKNTYLIHLGIVLGCTRAAEFIRGWR